MRPPRAPATVTVRPLADGVRHAFTGRSGGISPAPFDGLNLALHVGDADDAVLRNRALLAESLGIGPDRVVWMNQVHGNAVAVVDGPWTGPPPEVDALVTTATGLALAVLVADCTPVLLADPVAGVVAAAHAGRPGLVAGVVPAVIDAMVRLGARPERVRAATGPAVCGSCYEVPAGMRDEVAALVPAARATTRAGTPALDVSAGVWAQLAAAGVPAGARSAVCTLESPEHFSYRGAPGPDRRTGRFAGLVWLDS